MWPAVFQCDSWASLFLKVVSFCNDGVDLEEIEGYSNRSGLILEDMESLSEAQLAGIHLKAFSSLGRAECTLTAGWLDNDTHLCADVIWFSHEGSLWFLTLEWKAVLPFNFNLQVETQALLHRLRYVVKSLGAQLFSPDTQRAGNTMQQLLTPSQLLSFNKSSPLLSCLTTLP